MKKFNPILILFIAVVSIAIVTSCGDDEEPDPCEGINVPAGFMCVNGDIVEDPDGFCERTTCPPGFTCNESSDQCIQSDLCLNSNCPDGFICNPANGECESEGAEIVSVTSSISADATWTSDKIYVLGGRIAVLDGTTLTIEPGTIIKGEAGSGANSTALLIARGGKLMAEGTAEAPIIFTSVADEITPEDIVAGNFGSPNLDPDVDGLWGGVIILGRATISASNDNDEDISEVQIEGIPTSDPNGLYGGADDSDNSGVIRYVSIRHGGTNIGSGNEINGLTLGGVGSGTVIENIEIVSNQDDGVEWFGGTVNVKNVLCWNVNDDGIDTDQSWQGELDNFVVIAPAGHCFELDGPEGSFAAGHVIKNGTIIASAGGRVAQDLINVDENSIVDLENLFFTGIVNGQAINRVTAPGVTFTDIQLNVPAAELTNFVNGAVPAGVSAANVATVGADLSVFSWTWAVQAGALDNL